MRLALDEDPAGEFALIERLRSRLPAPGRDVRLGIGDDAAFIAPDLVWSCDLLIEGVHFRLSTSSLEDIGWKALAVNLSDLAACNATPIGALVGLGLPPDLADDDAAALYEGVGACSARYGCPVVGGDISRAPALTIAVSVLGRSPSPRRRDGARVGDRLCVTGSLGGSEAGRHLLEGLVCDLPPADREALLERHRRPAPRLQHPFAGLATALLDVSDGIAGDVRRLVAASGVRIELDIGLLPVQPGVSAVALALGERPEHFAARGGEDYELLGTLPPDVDLPVDATVIGRVVDGPPGLVAPGLDGVGGFDHRAVDAAT